MDDALTRRRFLGLSAGAAAAASLGGGALAACSSDDGAKAKAKAKPKPGSRLTDVDHVVILFQENRSFDQIFGTRKGVRGFADCPSR
jgi:phospholipase C